MKLQVSERFVEPIFETEFEKKQLNEFLQIQIPNFRHLPAYKRSNGKWKGLINLFDKTSSSFSIGFLRLVQEAFGISNNDVYDNRKYLNISEVKFPVYYKDNALFEWRPYQKKAIYNSLMYKNGLIKAATNAGKTMVIVALADLLRYEKPLIITHSKEIFDQIYRELTTYLGIPIGIITADETRLEKYVNLAMSLTLLNRYNIDDKINEYLSVDCNCVIVDEAHHVVSKTYYGLLRNINATYRLGFSGTVANIFDKAKKEADHYIGMKTREWLGDVICDVTNEELVQAGVSALPIVKMIIYRHSIDWAALERGIEVVEVDEKGRSISKIDQRRAVLRKRFQVAIENHIVNNVDRNGIIIDLLANKHSSMKFLVVVDRLEHGQNIYDGLKDKGVSVCFLHGKAKDRDNALDDFRDNKYRVLIATSLIDEGVNISSIQGLVLMPGKKSSRQVLQRIGRGLRKKVDDNRVLVYDFMDLNAKNFTEHSYERYKIYEKEKFNLLLVEYKDSDIIHIDKTQEDLIIQTIK